ncbi:hypothetical protein EDD11_005859 [Mortierella claussenii]|nr:hypothetical protein EDD11_005859 [Mortierella claussenii]
MITPSQVALHVYADFDSTVVLQDMGNTLLAHEMGTEELDRIDRLPETEPGQVLLRRAEDMKWERVKMTIQEAADILVDPSQVTSGYAAGSGSGSASGSGSGARPGRLTRSSSSFGSRRRVVSSRTPFDEANRTAAGHQSKSYHVQLDPGFKQFHRYCQEHKIPITIVSIGIQPLIEEVLNRYLGIGHGIEVRANGLTMREDGSWKVLWRDSSSDFPAALVADVVMARKNTSLEKLCRANSIPHRCFETFDLVLDVVKEWVHEHEHDHENDIDDAGASEP